MSLALAGDSLLAVTRQPELRARVTGLAREDGTVEWEETLADVTGAPTVVGDTCYVATGPLESAVHAFAPDGTRQWQTTIDGGCATPPCADRERVYVGLTDGRVVALDANTGRPRWDAPVATPVEWGPAVQASPTVVDDRLYVPGVQGELVAVRTTDGTVDWRTTVHEDERGDVIPSPAVTDDTAYVNTELGGLVAVALEDGTIRWRSGGFGTNRPAGVGPGGVVVPRDDSVVAVDTAGEDRWTVGITIPETDPDDSGYRMGTQVALAHGLCYASVADGRVYALGASGE